MMRPPVTTAKRAAPPVAIRGRYGRTDGDNADDLDHVDGLNELHHVDGLNDLDDFYDVDPIHYVDNPKHPVHLMRLKGFLPGRDCYPSARLGR